METSNLEFIPSGLVIGVVAGVVAGVTNAILFSAYDRWRKRETRRDQIQFIRDLILESSKRIGNIVVDTPAEEAPSVDQLRFLLVRRFATEFDEVISHRATELDGAQMFDLRKRQREIASAVVELVAMIDGLPSFPLQMWGDVYNSLSSVEWLKLPESPPWEIQANSGSHPG